VGLDAVLGSLHSSYIDEGMARVLVVLTDQHRRSREIDLTDSYGSGQGFYVFCTQLAVTAFEMAAWSQISRQLQEETE
jgi:hypothetical protein